MQKTSGSGTLREQLELVWRNTGRKPKELDDLIVLPENTKHVWDWFLALHNARSYGMSMNPISYSDIQAYFDLFDIKPDTWEVNCIKAMDVIAMNQAAKDSQTTSKKTKK